MPGRRAGVAGRRRRVGPAGKGRGRGRGRSRMDVSPTNPPPERFPGPVARKKKRK